MSTYSITYACDHTASVKLYGPRQSRDWQAQKEAERLCSDCFTAQRIEENKRAAAAASAAGLPALKGSEKQIAWAETLRQKVLGSTDLSPSQRAELAKLTESRFWIDNRDKSASALGVVASVRLAVAALDAGALAVATTLSKVIDSNHFDGGSLIAWKIGEVLLTPRAVDVLKDGRSGYLTSVGLDKVTCERLWKALQVAEIANADEVVTPVAPLEPETEQTLRSWLAEASEGDSAEYLPLLSSEDVQAIGDAMDVMLSAKASQGSVEVTSPVLDALRAGSPSQALWSLELLGEGKLPFSLRAVLAGKAVGRYLPIKNVTRPSAKEPVEVLMLCLEEQLQVPALSAKRLAEPVLRRALRKILPLSDAPESFRRRLGAE